MRLDVDGDARIFEAGVSADLYPEHDFVILSERAGIPFLARESKNLNRGTAATSKVSGFEFRQRAFRTRNMKRLSTFSYMRHCCARNQFPQRDTRRLRPHQRFTDQKRLVAGVAQLTQLGP